MLCDSEEKQAWVWLNMQPGIAPLGFQKILSRFGSAAGFLEACNQSSFPSGKNRLLASLARRACGWREESNAEMLRARRAGIDVITLAEPSYPAPLRHLEDAPPVLYISGSYRPEDDAAVALVGSRHPSPYGQSVAREFARKLVGYDVVTTSGLAQGVDTCVHESTLEAGGRTVAVLGSGLGRLYPLENVSLSDRIRSSGAVLSEFSMECPPYRMNFPRRNRIISGLALATVVIEAGDRSGALITARLAAEQGRDVFAVPGMVSSPLSLGAHRLIQQGAKLAGSVEDVLEEIEPLRSRLERGPRPVGNGTGSDGPAPALSPFEKRILSQLGQEPVPADRLALTLDRKPQELAAPMLALEMRGLVQTTPGNAYVRITRYR